MFIFSTFLSPHISTYVDTANEKHAKEMIQFAGKQLKSNSLISKNYIFFPMNVINSHWYLLVILNLPNLFENRKKNKASIILLDSLNSKSVNFRPPEFNAVMFLINSFLPKDVQHFTENNFLEIKGLKVFTFCLFNIVSELFTNMKGTTTNRCRLRILYD
jgi:hypothetical protein